MALLLALLPPVDSREKAVYSHLLPQAARPHFYYLSNINGWDRQHIPRTHEGRPFLHYFTRTCWAPPRLDDTRWRGCTTSGARNRGTHHRGTGLKRQDNRVAQVNSAADRAHRNAQRIPGAGDGGPWAACQLSAWKDHAMLQLRYRATPIMTLVAPFRVDLPQLDISYIHFSLSAHIPHLPSTYHHTLPLHLEKLRADMAADTANTARPFRSLSREA